MSNSHCRRKHRKGNGEEESSHSKSSSGTSDMKKADDDNNNITNSESKGKVGIFCSGLYYQVKDKTILDDIDFVATPGELTVIMGPSGSGKTTLLNSLLCRIKHYNKKLQGTIQLNNQAVSLRLVRKFCGYVMAFDSALSYLTVEETLVGTAKLLLPHLALKDVLEKVEEVIEILDLESCRHTYVGGEWRKGISKGQLKRLMIAQELLGEPPILVLDEPTTGLDSSLALDLVRTLRRIAHETGVAVIATIHQPSQMAFSIFDNLCLISSGQVLYQGKAGEAAQYFSHFGKICPHDFNPADFLLELATDIDYVGYSHPSSNNTPNTAYQPEEGDETFEKNDDELSPLQESNSKQHQHHHSFEDQVSKKATLMKREGLGPFYSQPKELELMKSSYRSSGVHDLVLKQIESLKHQIFNPETECASKAKAQARSWRLEYRVVWLRSTLNSMRNPMTHVVVWLVTILQALVLGGLFYQLQSDVNKVTSGPIREWNLWNSDFVKYFGLGMDKQGWDPLLDLIKKGTDGHGSQVLMDVATNQEVVDFIHTSLLCTYDMMNLTEHGYPKADFTGDDWQQRNLEAASKSSSPKPTVPDSLGVPYPIATMTLRQAISDVMIMSQLLDYLSLKRPPADISNLLQSKFNETEATAISDLQLGATFKAFTDQLYPWTTPFFCCFGMGIDGGVMSATDCTKIWPDKTFPLSVPKVVSHYMENPKNSAQTLLESALPLARQLASIKNPDSILKAGEVFAERRPFPRLLDDRSAPSRKLGAGLGALVTDLWSLIAGDPDSDIYKLLMVLSNVQDRMAACGSPVCRSFTNLMDYATTIGQDSLNTLLTVLNFAGAVFFCVANLGFASYDVLLHFPKERVIFNRERANGLYKGSSYFLAKCTADLPFQLFPALMWSIIYYWMIGMTNSASQFFTYLIACIGISFCAYSFGYMISSLSPRMEVAIIVAPLALVVMLVLAGFFLRDPDIPKWATLFKWLSIYRWGFFALIGIQFPSGGSYGVLPNEVIMAACGVTQANIAYTISMLFILAIAYRIVAYFGLVLTNQRAGLEV